MRHPSPSGPSSGDLRFDPTMLELIADVRDRITRMEATYHTDREHQQRTLDAILVEARKAATVSEERHRATEARLTSAETRLTVLETHREADAVAEDRDTGRVRTWVAPGVIGGLVSAVGVVIARLFGQQ